MALDFNAVKLLLWGKNLGVAFDRTLTLGHQGLACSPGQLRRALSDFGHAASSAEIERCFQHPPCTAVYADEFLRLLGAKDCVVVDRSDFEGANLLHDLNEPFPQKDHQTFSLVVDGGTLEHIFNYPAALRHCLELVRPGGHFLTMTPAQNMMGHGFYQFSPELFFRVFSAENGFALRKLVLYDGQKADSDFYAVNDPAATGLRSELQSNRPMYLGVLAQRTGQGPILAQPPQQSDYVAVWERSRQKSAGTGGAKSEPLSKFRQAVSLRVPFWLRRWKNSWLYGRRQGAPRLGNQRHFRRLSREEICQEKGGPASSQPPHGK